MFRVLYPYGSLLAHSENRRLVHRATSITTDPGPSTRPSTPGVWPINMGLCNQATIEYRQHPQHTLTLLECRLIYVDAHWPRVLHPQVVKRLTHAVCGSLQDQLCQVHQTVCAIGPRRKGSPVYVINSQGVLPRDRFRVHDVALGLAHQRQSGGGDPECCKRRRDHGVER